MFSIILKGLFLAHKEIAIILFKNRHCGLGVRCCKQLRLHQGQVLFFFGLGHGVMCNASLLSTLLRVDKPDSATLTHNP